MGQINRRREVKLWIFFYSGLLVDGLQGSHFAEPFIEVDVGLAVGQTHDYLVDSWTPAHSADGTVSDCQGFYLFEGSCVVEVEVAQLILNALAD